MKQAGVHTAAHDEALWVEILNALPNNSLLHAQAFAQLQGIAEPFQVAMSILTALPQGLRQRSQQILRTWAACEAAREVTRIEARHEKKEQREHELALRRLEQNNHAPVAKRARLSISAAAAAAKKRSIYETTRARARNSAAKAVAPVTPATARRIVVGNSSDQMPTPVASGAAAANGDFGPTMYMLFKTHTMSKDPEISLSLIKSRWKAMSPIEQDEYKVGGALANSYACASSQRTSKPSDDDDTRQRTVFKGKVPCNFSECEGNGKNMTKGMCKRHGGRLKCGHASGCEKARIGRGMCCKHGGGVVCGFAGGCQKVALSKGFCFEHGGGHKCKFVDGCEKKSVRRGLCQEHGGSKKCIKPGCGNQSQSSDFCIAHGGGKRCGFEGGCGTLAERRGFCKEHGGQRICEFEGGGCKERGREGGLCHTHGGGVWCTFEGCKKQQGLVKRGFCTAHGGRKYCCVVDCGKTAAKFGLCSAHGGFNRCSFEGGCGKHAKWRGLCFSHGGRQQKSD